jgi:hypothetical protein
MLSAMRIITRLRGLCLECYCIRTGGAGLKGTSQWATNLSDVTWHSLSQQVSLRSYRLDSGTPCCKTLMIATRVL